jgi:predicted acyl esterase
VYGIRPVARQNIKNVTFYVMSANDDAGRKAGQYWTSLETWPTPKMTDYFFQADGSLSTAIPSSESVDQTSYKVDPANPILTVGGNNLPPDIGGSIPCGPMDQSEVDKRDDVLLFQTPVLDEDLPLTGPLLSTLYVSSDVVDTDFMVRFPCLLSPFLIYSSPRQVKISDVYPTGEAILIQDSAIRMRWREGGLTPVYMQSGAVYEVTVSVPFSSLLSYLISLCLRLPLLSGTSGTPLGSSLLVILFVSQCNPLTILASL